MTLLPLRSLSSVLASFLALAATGAQAMAPPLPTCYPTQDDMGADEPTDLGDGFVARMETFYQSDDAYRSWTVVTQCESGQSIAVQVETWEESEAAKAFVRSAIASEEVMTLAQLAQRLDRAFGEAFLDQSRPANAETCVCWHFHPEMRGDKAPYGS